jgi:hypothetical protein
MQTDPATESDAAIDTALAFFRTNSALDELHPSERAAVRAGLGAIVQLLLARERGAVLVAEFAVSALAGLGGYGAERARDVHALLAPLRPCERAPQPATARPESRKEGHFRSSLNAKRDPMLDEMRALRIDARRDEGHAAASVGFYGGAFVGV